MNFSSMDYFVMAAQEKNFTHAAERLHITQQTLSTHIANLEKELGSRLFVRSTPLELTYAGQVFLAYATDFRRKRQTLEREMGDIANDQRGLLRIGIASTRGRTIMPPLIHAFREKHPFITIKLIEAVNDQLQQALREAGVDLTRTPGLEVRDFYQEEVVLLATRSLLERVYGPSAEALEEQIRRDGLKPLENCPFLFNSPQDIAGRIGRGLLAQAGMVPRIAAESSNMETLLSLCVLGEGVCFCPENLMRTALRQDEVDKLSLFRLGAEGRYMIRLACLKQEHRWSALEDFIHLALGPAV